MWPGQAGLAACASRLILVAPQLEDFSLLPPAEALLMRTSTVYYTFRSLRKGAHTPGMACMTCIMLHMGSRGLKVNRVKGLKVNRFKGLKVKGYTRGAVEDELYALCSGVQYSELMRAGDDDPGTSVIPIDAPWRSIMRNLCV